MCFRPAEAGNGSEKIFCSNCGKRVFEAKGVLPNKCPFCKEDLVPRYGEGEDPGFKAPEAPKAPSAPGVPGAPKAPEAPKAPTASAE